VAAIALAGVVDELILKPLLVVPADRLASEHPKPVDDSVASRANEPIDGSGTPLRNVFNAVVSLGTLISTRSYSGGLDLCFYTRVVKRSSFSDNQGSSTLPEGIPTCSSIHPSAWNSYSANFAKTEF
jgi:hypothetical protein